MNDFRRVLIHPGFHKTGTSTTQHFLWRNKSRIESRAHLFMLRHLKPVASLALRFSKTGNPLVLLDMSEALDQIFADVPEDGRDILISCEGLSGHLPGWPGVVDYSAAPVILSYLVGFLSNRFATDDVQVTLSTRDPIHWLWSAYRHHLRGHRMVLDWPAFQAQYAGAADFAPIVAAMASDLRRAPTLLPLEQAQTHPQGPGGALLASFDWPDPLDGWETVAPGNLGPDDDLWPEFLRLNRSDLTDDALKAEKDRLSKQAGLAGWTRG